MEREVTGNGLRVTGKTSLLSPVAPRLLPHNKRPQFPIIGKLRSCLEEIKVQKRNRQPNSKWHRRSFQSYDEFELPDCLTVRSNQSNLR